MLQEWHEYTEECSCSTQQDLGNQAYIKDDKTTEHETSIYTKKNGLKITDENIHILRDHGNTSPVW
jgi:hypothetical protein